MGHLLVPLPLSLLMLPLALKLKEIYLKERIPVMPNLFQEMEEEGRIDSFYEVRIILIPKPDKHITRHIIKRKYMMAK